MTTPVCTRASNAAAPATQTLAYPSFASYVRARQPVLLRTARSLTANPSDAEDLLQTALTKTYVAWERIGHDRGIQGNLDGAVLLGPWERAEAGAHDVLERAGGRPGHIFNLGHGVLPETDPELLGRLVELVHAQTMVAA